MATDEITENKIEILPITTAHLIEVSKLPYFHKDPFDRLIIAQAIVENLPVLTADPAFDQYPIQRVA